MEGAGNDFVVVEKSQRSDADFRYRIWNADGGEVEQCGNGARCFVRFVHDKGLTHKTQIRVETLSGVIAPRLESDGQVSVDMGAPRLGWRDIPLARDCDTLNVPLTLGPLIVPVCTSMGNPHATFFVAGASSFVSSTAGLLRHSGIAGRQIRRDKYLFYKPSTARQ